MGMIKKGQLVKTFSNIKIAYVNSTGSPLQTLPTTEDAAAIIATVQQQRNTLPASFEQEEDNASKKKDFFATFKRTFTPLTEAEKRDANIQLLVKEENKKVVEKSRIQSKIDNMQKELNQQFKKMDSVEAHLKEIIEKKNQMLQSSAAIIVLLQTLPTTDDAAAIIVTDQQPSIKVPASVDQEKIKKNQEKLCR